MEEPYDVDQMSLWDNHWLTKRMVRKLAVITAFDAIPRDRYVAICHEYSFADQEALRAHLDNLCKHFEWTHDFDFHGSKVNYLATMALCELDKKSCLAFIKYLTKYLEQFDSIIEDWMAELEMRISE